MPWYSFSSPSFIEPDTSMMKITRWLMILIPKNSCLTCVVCFRRKSSSPVRTAASCSSVRNANLSFEFSHHFAQPSALLWKGWPVSRHNAFANSFWNSSQFLQCVPRVDSF